MILPIDTSAEAPERPEPFSVAEKEETEAPEESTETEASEENAESESLEESREAASSEPVKEETDPLEESAAEESSPAESSREERSPDESSVEESRETAKITAPPQKSLSLQAQAPENPANVKAVSGNKQITISWSAVPSCDSYRIYRSESNIISGANQEKKIAEVNASVLSYVDKAVQDGMIYEYYVTAVSGGTESVRGPYLRGAYAWTSYIEPGLYGVKVTGLTENGFTVSGMAASTAGIGKVQIPVWTEKNGQDDIIWHEAAVSGNSFSLNVRIADHKNEKGTYNVHIYCRDKNSVLGSVYALNVHVPDGKAHLSDPYISKITKDSYEIALTFEAPKGVSSVKVATYTEKDGKKKYKLSNAEIDSKNGIIRATIRTKDHGGFIGNYYTTVFLTDKSGNTDSHTFTVKHQGEEETLSAVTSVNVLQGDATLIESGGEFLLVDTGPLEASYARLTRVLLEHRAKDVTVLITHPHSDHIEGLRELVNSVSVKAVYLNDVVSDYWFDNFIREETVKLLKAKGIPVYGTPEIGKAFPVGALTATVIGPARYYRIGENGVTNNNSIYLRVEGNGKRFLLAGDSERIAEEDMLKSGADVKADFFKASHHGYGSSSSPDFISAVAARIVLISTYNPPSADVVKRFQSSGAAIYRTSAGGSIALYMMQDGRETVLKHDSSDTNSVLKPVLITYGDVNSDGKWDVIDVSYMYSHILGKKKLKDTMFMAADVNGDGTVNVIDVSYIYAYILKKIKTVPQR